VKKIDKKKGIVFWVTGLSGAGKSAISKKILPFINKKYGPTLSFSGDELRKLLDLNKYSKNERFKVGLTYSRIAKNISDKNINVLIDVIGLFNKLRIYNKKHIKNYVEIYIRSSLKTIQKKGKKNLYLDLKSRKKIWGLGLKPEFPKNSHIVINNDFSKSIKKLSQELEKKINKTLK
jgi:adenylylsulfate kinase-like enzyme